MKRLFCFALAIVAALTLMTQICWSDEQGPPYWESCWHWGNLVCNGTKAFVCPCGGGSYIYAHIVGKNHVVEQGATVTATFQATPAVALCKPVSGVTDANGNVTLHVCAGLNLTGGRDCLTVTTTVVVYNYETIRWCPVCPNSDPLDLTCREVDERQWLSPDMNGDLSVNASDFSIFGADWLSDACRSDFNCDGVVNASDYSLFASHWLHNCSRCP